MLIAQTICSFMALGREQICYNTIVKVHVEKAMNKSK
jgi:hypothetical protein